MAYLALKHPRRPRPTRPALPRGLEAIILRAADPDPDRCYPTAQTMADDLERFLAAPPRRAVVRPAHGHMVPTTTRGAV